MASLANLSLQKRIALLVIAGLTIGLGLFAWISIQSVNESIERTLNERLTIARVIAGHLDETVTHILSYLKNAGAGRGLPSAPEFNSMASSLRSNLANAGISTQEVILLDKAGQIIHQEAGRSTVVLDINRYPALTKAVYAGQPAISGLVSNSPADRSAIVAAAPVTDNTGSIVGMVVSLHNSEQLGVSNFGPTVTVGKSGYIEIVDERGVVIARTRPGVPPGPLERSDHPARFAALIEKKEATTGTCHRCHEENESNRQRDVLAFAPLTTASWGVVIRQSEEEALAPANNLETRLLFFGIIVLLGALFLAWTIIRGVVSPIKMLTAASKRVAAGELKAPTPSGRKDEIGQLSRAFYAMTQDLAKSRNELLMRNEELLAMNSIAGVVSQSLNLEEVLKNALQKVLQFVSSPAGCMTIREPDSDKLRLISTLGKSKIFGCDKIARVKYSCACHEVSVSGQTIVVRDSSQCSAISLSTPSPNGFFVCVPLMSKQRVVGVMNIVCPNGCSFTEHDFSILESIGQHIGLAIENSFLYEQAKQKEILRGQLLSRVISAQEEERKRVARELHDEHSQVLAGLIMTVESLESAAPKQPLFTRKLSQAKDIISRALLDIRRLTLDLRPSTLDDLGLAATIRAYAQTHLENAGIQVEFVSAGPSQRLPAATETTLFRILQEALRNIEKHARASRVRILLEVNNNKVSAIVEDNGKGFDVDLVFRSKVGTQSLGLLGIQERATLLGGKISVKSQVGNGTQIIVEIPLAAEESVK